MQKQAVADDDLMHRDLVATDLEASGSFLDTSIHDFMHDIEILMPSWFWGQFSSMELFKSINLPDFESSLY
jgi:hypothetical protein